MLASGTTGRPASGIGRGGGQWARTWGQGAGRGGGAAGASGAVFGRGAKDLAGLESGWKAAGNRLANFYGHFNGLRAVWGLSGTGQETDPVEDRLRTINQQLAHVKMMIALDDLETDLRDARKRNALIPADWGKLETTAPTRPRKKKVTVALDTDVLRWFHGLGAGYHGRINAVLRTYMLALISKEVLSQGDKDRRGDEIWGKAAPEKKKEE